MAKYPFSPQAAEYIKLLGLRIENLANPELKPILVRAESRIEEALLNNPPEVSYRTRDEDVEIPSFPVAVMMAAATNNDYVKRRYALAEARRAYNLLRLEDETKILDIAISVKWRVKKAKRTVGSRSYDFSLRFIDFLENAKHFREKEWKLINKVMEDGWVYLTKQEIARLLQEEVRKHLEKRLQVKVRSMLPENVTERVDRLVQTYASKIRRVRFEELPKTAVDAAFPPCIRQLHDDAAAGRRLSHIGRFALTSFLLSVGIPREKVIDLFRSSADFNERMTRYQVEHISGARGSRTSYIPPSCDTLRTHGVCPGTDDLCREIRHPLAYYRRKLRMIKMAVSAGQR
ncbi:MAG: hypothetical protein ACE5NN_03340 [Candidatus Bathyarchaeia archaeon]